MTFRVGQKVVCVDDGQDPLAPHACWLDGDKPTVGWIYTVMGYDKPDLGRPCIFINGFPDWSFLACRFRPLVERKTSIEVFTQMLNPQKVTA
jgi:hypothetical protein